MDRSCDEEILQRLKRIEGQLKGIQRMVAEHRDCEQIVTQLLAARSALDSAGAQIVRAHVAICLESLPPEKMRASVSRMVDLLSRMT
jgi:CsoR family transcriptional regulator, copper-sensing transcriptional repressor